MNRAMGRFFSKWVVPTYENSYFPYFLRKGALAAYTVLIIFVNLFSQVFVTRALAGEVSAADLVSLTNQDRVAAGLSELTEDARLVSAAYAKAEDIFRYQYWAHYGPNGQTPWQFINASGYNYVIAGENLAKGFTSSEGVNSAWMASKTHRENILNSEYENIGIAVVSGELLGDDVFLVVQMFGKMADENEPVVPVLSQLPTSSDQKVEINSPQDGAVLSDKNVIIEGTSTSEIKELSVLENFNLLGRSICNDGIWDYRPEESWKDGSHKIQVDADVQGVTDSVTFEIDTVAPEISEESLNVAVSHGVIERLVVSVKVLGDPVEVKLLAGDLSYDFVQSGTGFSVEVPANQFENEKNVKISATDQAGNTSFLDVSGEVLGEASVKVSPAGIQLGSVKTANPADVFNRVLIGFIAVIMIVDIVYLLRFRILHTRVKTLFPMAIWILLAGIAIIAGHGGVISAH